MDEDNEDPKLFRFKDAQYLTLDHEDSSTALLHFAQNAQEGEILFKGQGTCDASITFRCEDASGSCETTELVFNISASSSYERLNQLWHTLSFPSPSKESQATGSTSSSTERTSLLVFIQDKSQSDEFERVAKIDLAEKGPTHSGKSDSIFDAKTDFASSDMYFHYYGQLIHQQNMLQDFIRTSTYYSAFLENHSDFKDAVVVDVGAGTGILSFFAVQAGARCVYAIEASDMFHHMSKLVESNRELGNKIHAIHGRVEDIDLPEKADILISEPMGTLLVNERMLESYVIARKRFLKPGGKMFPTLGRIHISPFTDEHLYIEMIQKAGFWQQEDYFGVSLTSLHSDAAQSFFSQPVIDSFSPSILMASPQTHIIDFTTATERHLQEINIPMSFHVENGGRCHGVACWFDVLFNGSNHTCWLSTAPGLPTTHWHQLRCTVKNPLVCFPGEKLEGHFSLHAHRRQSYYIDIKLSKGKEPELNTASARMDLKDPYFRLAHPPIQSHSVEHEADNPNAGPPGIEERPLWPSEMEDVQANEANKSTTMPAEQPTPNTLSVFGIIPRHVTTLRQSQLLHFQRQQMEQVAAAERVESRRQTQPHRYSPAQ